MPESNTPAHVLPETTALALVGCLDLVATVYLLASGHAVEANRLFSAILERSGPIGFIAFKALFVAVPLIIAEYARRHNPDFVRRALRIGLTVYILAYAAAVAIQYMRLIL